MMWLLPWPEVPRSFDGVVFLATFGGSLIGDSCNETYTCNPTDATSVTSITNKLFNSSSCLHVEKI